MSLLAIFLDMSPQTMETSKNKQMKIHKTKKFCTVKENINSKVATY